MLDVAAKPLVGVQSSRNSCIIQWCQWYCEEGQVNSIVEIHTNASEARSINEIMQVVYQSCFLNRLGTSADRALLPDLRAVRDQHYLPARDANLVVQDRTDRNQLVHWGLQRHCRQVLSRLMKLVAMLFLKLVCSVFALMVQLCGTSRNILCQLATK